ncbi:MAG: methyltransferase domain-containing protein [Pseudomonadota bacterium]
MGLTSRLPGLFGLRDGGGRRDRSIDQIDGHALLDAVENAGPKGSSHRLIAIVSTYEMLKDRVDSGTWHQIPGLLEFVRLTGEYIPMVPAAILERALESPDTPARPQVFLSAWRSDGGLVDQMDIDGEAFMDFISADSENATPFIARTGPGAANFFLRYAQRYHSIAIAKRLGATRIIDFGSTNAEFGQQLVRTCENAEVCVVNENHPDGLKSLEPRVRCLGAPPQELGLFEDESVDLVVAHNRFERLLGLQDQRAVSEVERVLVRGGRFLIAPFLASDQHTLTVSPFSCFIANGETDFALTIEAEIRGEDARVDFNPAIVTPISRRYDLASTCRRILEHAPSMTARLRTFSFTDLGFGPDGQFNRAFETLQLERDLFEKRSFLALELVKH